MGESPEEARVAAGAAASADGEAADREADAERRRSRSRSALAAEEGGADALSLINTLRAAPSIRTPAEPWLGGGTGGLSGPAVRAVALAQVRAVAAAVSVPVIGMGGISTGRDAAELLEAGARSWSRSARRASGTRPPGSRIAAELAGRVRNESFFA